MSKFLEYFLRFLFFGLSGLAIGASARKLQEHYQWDTLPTLIGFMVFMIIYCLLAVTVEYKYFRKED